MDDADFAILDNAIEAGGNAVPAKALAGSGKAGKERLTRLCEAGLLAASGNKYSLTPAGRAAWDERAPAARKEELRRRDEEAKHKALTEFLALVAAKPNKTLAGKEMRGVPGAVVAEAQTRRFVEPGDRPNSFRLLPAGDEILLAALPATEQLGRLREGYQRVAGLWDAAQQRIRDDLRSLARNAEADAAVDRALATTRQRVSQARAAFEGALKELQAFAGLSDAARQLREALLDATRAEAGPDTDRNEGKAVEQRIQTELSARQTEFEALRRLIEGRLSDLERKLPATAEPPRPAPPASSVNEEAVWQSTRTAHDRLKRETQHIGGLVKVPELTDEVRKAHPDLAAKQFHGLLSRWQGEDRLVLQVCSDPYLEPRAAEGIEAPKGLLFYVVIR